MIKKWNASTQQTATLVSSGLSGPQGVAVDGAGNVYIADGHAIKEWNAITQQVITLVSGLNLATGVAVDGSGNVTLADPGNSQIEKWSASTQQVTTLVSREGCLPMELQWTTPATFLWRSIPLTRSRRSRWLSSAPPA